MKHSSRRGARALFSDPLLRVIPAGLALIAVVLVFTGLSRLMHKPNPDILVPADASAAAELTPPEAITSSPSIARNSR